MAKINQDIEALVHELNTKPCVRFVFLKKSDGSFREARGTRKPSEIPIELRHKGKKQPPSTVLTFYDLDKGAWRCLLRDQLLGWIEE